MFFMLCHVEVFLTVSPPVTAHKWVFGLVFHDRGDSLRNFFHNLGGGPFDVNLHHVDLFHIF